MKKSDERKVEEGSLRQSVMNFHGYQTVLKKW